MWDELRPEFMKARQTGGPFSFPAPESTHKHRLGEHFVCGADLCARGNMAFPGNSVTSLAGKWSQIKDFTGRIKNKCVSLGAQSAITRTQVLEFQNFLADALDQLNTLTANASTNGLLEYARAQESNPSLDLTAEYTAMRNQLVAVQNWTVSNFPATTGELRVYTFDANKRYVNINLTSGELSAFKTQLSNLSASIS